MVPHTSPYFSSEKSPLCNVGIKSETDERCQRRKAVHHILKCLKCCFLTLTIFMEAGYHEEPQFIRKFFPSDLLVKSRREIMSISDRGVLSTAKCESKRLRSLPSTVTQKRLAISVDAIL